MSTFTQNLKVAAKRKKDNRRTPILGKCPHAKGWVNRVTIITPRKPNSAKRPIVKVFLRKMGRLTAHIPGIGHTLKKYGKVLVRGRGPRDLPGVRYSCVRGVLDFIGLKKKKRRRSIYGAEQNDLTKIRARRKYRFAIRRAERDRVQKENEQNIIDSHAPVLQSIIDVEKKKKINLPINHFNKNIEKLLCFSKKKIIGLNSRMPEQFPAFFIKQYICFLILDIRNINQVFLFLNLFFFKKNNYKLDNISHFLIFKNNFSYNVVTQYQHNINYSYFNIFSIFSQVVCFGFLQNSKKYFIISRKPYISKNDFFNTIAQDKKYLKKLTTNFNTISTNNGNYIFKRKLRPITKYYIDADRFISKKKFFLSNYTAKKFSKNFQKTYSFFFSHIFFLKKFYLCKQNFFNKKTFLMMRSLFFYSSVFCKKLKSYKSLRYLHSSSKKNNKIKHSIYFFKKKQNNKLKNFFIKI